MSAASPRWRTSATMSRTVASTLASVDCERSSRRSNVARKPASRVLRRAISSAMSAGHAHQQIDDALHGVALHLHRRTIGDEPGRDVDDVLDFDETISLERVAARDEIDDAVREP